MARRKSIGEDSENVFLTVKVLSASGLAPIIGRLVFATASKPSPFVELQVVGPSERVLHSFRTKTKKKTNSPSFDEAFTCTLEAPKDDLPFRLIARVLSATRGKPVFMGTVAVDLHELQQKDIDGWYPLEKENPEDHVMGEIRLQMSVAYDRATKRAIDPALLGIVTRKAEAEADSPSSPASGKLPRKLSDLPSSFLMSNPGGMVEYRYDLPDEPSLIVFTEEPHTTQTLEAATLFKVVELLTRPANGSQKGALRRWASKREVSQEFDDFLTCFPNWTDSGTLLRLLVLRYKGNPDINSAEYIKTLRPVQDKVVNFVIQWLQDEHYRADILSDSEVLTWLEQRAGDVWQKEYVLQGALSSAKAHKEKQDRKGNGEISLAAEAQLDSTSMHDSVVMAYATQELAQQLTLLEAELVASIDPRHLLRQRWAKDPAGAATVVRYIDHFNRISRWLATEVLNQEQAVDRAVIVTKIVEIAQRCRELSNYNGLMEVLSALHNAAVARLKETWGLVPKGTIKTFDELTELMNPTSNFKSYRNAIQTDKLFIPYMGLHLSDLSFIDDCNENFIGEHKLLNYGKVRLMASVIRTLRSSTSLSYESVHGLSRVRGLVSLLGRQEGWDDKELYRISRLKEGQQELRIGPRGKKTKKKRLKSIGSAATQMMQRTVAKRTSSKRSLGVSDLSASDWESILSGIEWRPLYLEPGEPFAWPGETPSFLFRVVQGGAQIHPEQPVPHLPLEIAPGPLFGLCSTLCSSATLSATLSAPSDRPAIVQCLPATELVTLFSLDSDLALRFYSWAAQHIAKLYANPAGMGANVSQLHPIPFRPVAGSLPTPTSSPQGALSPRRRAYGGPGRGPQPPLPASEPLVRWFSVNQLTHPSLPSGPAALALSPCYVCLLPATSNKWTVYKGDTIINADANPSGLVTIRMSSESSGDPLTFTVILSSLPDAAACRGLLLMAKSFASTNPPEPLPVDTPPTDNSVTAEDGSESASSISTNTESNVTANHPGEANVQPTSPGKKMQLKVETLQPLNPEKPHLLSSSQELGLERMQPQVVEVLSESVSLSRVQVGADNTLGEAPVLSPGRTEEAAQEQAQQDDGDDEDETKLSDEDSYEHENPTGVSGKSESALSPPPSSHAVPGAAVDATAPLPGSELTGSGNRRRMSTGSLEAASSLEESKKPGAIIRSQSLQTGLGSAESEDSDVAEESLEVVRAAAQGVQFHDVDSSVQDSQEMQSGVDVKDDRGSAFPGVKLRKRESVMVQGSLLLKPRSLQHQQQQQTSPGKTLLGRFESRRRRNSSRSERKKSKKSPKERLKTSSGRYISTSAYALLAGGVNSPDGGLQKNESAPAPRGHATEHSPKPPRGDPKKVARGRLLSAPVIVDRKELARSPLIRRRQGLIRSDSMSEGLEVSSPNSKSSSRFTEVSISVLPTLEVVVASRSGDIFKCRLESVRGSLGALNGCWTHSGPPDMSLLPRDSTRTRAPSPLLQHKKPAAAAATPSQGSASMPLLRLADAESGSRSSLPPKLTRQPSFSTQSPGVLTRTSSRSATRDGVGISGSVSHHDLPSAAAAAAAAAAARGRGNTPPQLRRSRSSSERMNQSDGVVWKKKQPSKDREEFVPSPSSARGLTPGDWSLLVKDAPSETVASGKTLIDVGDALTKMFKISSGSVQLEGPNGLDLGRLGEGEVFAELTFVPCVGGSRVSFKSPYRVTTLEQTELVTIKAPFVAVLERKYRGFASRFRKFLCVVLSERLAGWWNAASQLKVSTPKPAAKAIALPIVNWDAGPAPEKQIAVVEQVESRSVVTMEASPSRKPSDSSSSSSSTPSTLLSSNSTFKPGTDAEDAAGGDDDDVEEDVDDEDDVSTPSMEEEEEDEDEEDDEVGVLPASADPVEAQRLLNSQMFTQHQIQVFRI